MDFQTGLKSCPIKYHNFTKNVQHEIGAVKSFKLNKFCVFFLSWRSMHVPKYSRTSHGWIIVVSALNVTVWVSLRTCFIMQIRLGDLGAIFRYKISPHAAAWILERLTTCRLRCCGVGKHYLIHYEYIELKNSAALQTFISPTLMSVHYENGTQTN